MIRRKKVINGFVLKTIYMILSVVLAFFMMPFILHTLGDRMYGIWLLVGSVMGFGGYMDLGLSSAVQRFVSRAVGQNDTTEINEVINTTFVIYLFISAATLLITFAVISGASFFVNSPEDLRIVRVLILILGLNMAIGFPTRAFGAVIGSNLRYEVSEGIDLMSLILRNGLILLLFSLGFRIISLGFILFFTSVLSYALYMYFSLSLFGGVRFDLRLFNRKRVWELFSYSVYSFIYKLSELLIFRVDFLVISFFIGAAAVAHYAIASTLVSYFMFFIFNAFGLIGPVYSQDEGRGDMEGIRHKFLLTTKVAVFMTVFIGTMIIMYSGPFISRWMGPAYLDAYPALVVLVTASIAHLMQVPSTTVLYNISRHKFLAYTGVVEGVLNLALSIILVRHWGLLGVAFGTAVPMVLMRLIIQPIYVCSTLALSKARYYGGTLAQSVFIALVAMVPVYLYIGGYAAPSYPRLMLLYTAHALVYGVFVLFAGFSRVERKYLLGFLWKKLDKTPSFGTA